MPAPKDDKPIRYMNLDLLRIVAMLMVVLLHVIGKGGMYNVYPVLSLKYDFVWFIELICIVAVNCYVLLSGYFLIKSKFKLGKLIQLIGEVLFYSIFIYLISIMAGNASFGFEKSLIAFFPVIGGEYWFITAYVGMYMLAPFINTFIEKLNRVQHARLIAVLVLFFSFMPTLSFFGDAFGVAGNQLNFGYATSWFIVLYFVAAYIRLWYTPTYNLHKYFRIYLAIVGVNFVSFLVATMLLHEWNVTILTKYIEYMLAYNSITVFASSIALFMVFLNLRIYSPAINMAIAKIAPLTLATYLIHENPNVRNVLWKSLDIAGHAYNKYFIVYAVICAVGIYVGSILIDYARRYGFGILLKVDMVKVWLKRAQRYIELTAVKSIRFVDGMFT